MIPINDVLGDIATSLSSSAVLIAGQKDVESWTARPKSISSKTVLAAVQTSDKPESVVNIPQQPVYTIAPSEILNLEKQESEGSLMPEGSELEATGPHFKPTSLRFSPKIANPQEAKGSIEGNPTTPLDQRGDFWERQRPAIQFALPLSNDQIEVHGENDNAKVETSELKEKTHGDALVANNSLAEHQSVIRRPSSIEPPFSSAQHHINSAILCCDNRKKPPNLILGFLILIALSLALFVVEVDDNIVATAIPTISDEFGSLTHSGWYVCAFKLAASAFYLINLR